MIVIAAESKEDHIGDLVLDELVCNQRLTGRFCGWSGFADRLSWEMAVSLGCDVEKLKPLLKAIGKEAILVNDIPGFIAPRVLSVIINEACYAIAEGISDAEQIDIAMKLGTNYPQGPISWGKKIGATRISGLLNAMAMESSRYQAHNSLIKFLS